MTVIKPWIQLLIHKNYQNYPISMSYCGNFYYQYLHDNMVTLFCSLPEYPPELRQALNGNFSVSGLAELERKMIAGKCCKLSFMSAYKFMHFFKYGKTLLTCKNWINSLRMLT